jgi:hypothetical protein
MGMQHGNGKWACMMDRDKQRECQNANEKFFPASLVFR